MMIFEIIIIVEVKVPLSLTGFSFRPHFVCCSFMASIRVKSPNCVCVRSLFSISCSYVAFRTRFVVRLC